MKVSKSHVILATRSLIPVLVGDTHSSVCDSFRTFITIWIKVPVNREMEHEHEQMANTKIITVNNDTESLVLLPFDCLQ